MSMTDAKAAIRAKLEAEWQATPIAWPNEGFDRPTQEPWVYVEILGGGSESTVFGSDGKRVARDDGIIFAHVFVPVGTGEAVATEYAVQLGEIFRVKRFNGISTGAPSVGVGEQGDDDGLYWRVSVSIPFSIHYTA